MLNYILAKQEPARLCTYCLENEGLEVEGIEVPGYDGYICQDHIEGIVRSYEDRQVPHGTME